jgi:hypothetical protein
MSMTLFHFNVQFPSGMIALAPLKDLACVVEFPFAFASACIVYLHSLLS